MKVKVIAKFTKAAARACARFSKVLKVLILPRTIKPDPTDIVPESEIVIKIELGDDDVVPTLVTETYTCDGGTLCTRKDPPPVR